MADSLRLQILKNLTTVIEQVNGAGGYTNDLTDAVFRGRLYYGTDDPLPMVSILEAPRQPDPDDHPLDAPSFDGDWDLLIQGWTKDDKNNPTDPAHLLLAEVKKAIATEFPKLNDRLNPALGTHKVTKMKMGGGVVRPPDEEGGAKAFFWLLLSIRLCEDLTNPFSL